MTVRAKFKCDSVTMYISYDKKRIYEWSFSAVTSGSKENENFFAWTPSGTVKLGATVVDQFELGKEYYLDFTPAVVPVAAEAE